MNDLALWNEACTFREQLGEDFEEAHRELMLELDQAWQSRDPVPLRAALEQFHQARLHWGPSPFPLVNLLRNLEDLSVEQADGLLSASEEFFAQAMQELTAAEFDGLPGWSLKKTALGSVREALAALRSGSPEPEQQIARVEEAMQSMHRADEQLYQDTFLQGPTAMPMVNLVVQVARRVLLGQLAQESLAVALDSFSQAFESLEGDFERVAAAPADSALVQEELPKTRLAFALVYNAVEDLGAQLESWNGAEVSSCLARLEAAAHRLHASYRVFADFEAARDQTACPRCGHLNELTARVCQGCQAQLPRFSLDTLGQGFLLQEETAELPAAAQAVVLLECCGAFYDGLIEADVFRQQIEVARAALESSRQHLRQLSIVEGSGSEGEAAQVFLDQSREQLEQALQDWDQGLDLLEEHSHRLDFESLEEGIAQVWRASQSLVGLFQAWEPRPG